MKTQLSVIIIALGLALMAPVYASEVTGTLCSGLNCSIEGVVIVSPVASPVGGTYTSLQNVALVALGSTEIRYTTDGSTPHCATTGIKYVLAIPVSQNLTIKALSCYPNSNSSTATSFAYVINISTPVASGGSGSGGGGGGGGGGGMTTSITTTLTLSVAAQKIDANKDNKIDVLDFNTLMVNWEKAGTGNIADFNSDGKVDIFDFNSLMINWTK